jgi:penicillin-binding protein 2
MERLPIIEKLENKSSSFNFINSEKTNPVFIFKLIIIFIFLILGIRLFQLTVVKGSYFRRLSDENRLREYIIEPKRGEITDRNGEIIARTELGNKDEKKERIESKRIYEIREEIAHLVGYRQTADKNDHENDNCLVKMKLGDKIGKKGIEKIYECDLRGKNGTKLVEVDAKGNYLKTFSIVQPEDGKTIQLAIDLKLQKKAYEIIKDKKAAVVALNPKTGEILTFVSTPSFNPQVFEDKNQTKIKEYFSDMDYPMFNRITDGTYPIGSIIKPFIAIGALEDKKLDEKTIIEDTGSITAGQHTFGNWYFLDYGKTEGELNVVRAIKRSNDIFFYKTGERLGPSRIKFWANKFGFGEKTNLNFDQSEGLIPSPFWKEEVLQEQWYLGDTYNMSIGQGYFLTTPIQVAQATSTIANNGNLCQMNLLKEDKTKCKSLGIKMEYLNLIKEGMKQACSAGGTGWPLFDFGIIDKNQSEATESAKIKKIQTACKTGTAESADKKSEPHAWITVFAPFKNPEIVVTILVENGGQGSDIAGPIAKEILKTYFEN